MKKKKYKIFDTCWHVAHQSDMMHALLDDCEFHLCVNTKRQWTDSRVAAIRPVPAGVEFVSHYEPGKYDVAILHIDQQVMSPHHQKRMIYQQFDSIITDIPKIVINHGTPVYPEGILTEARPNYSDLQIQDICIKSIKDLVKDNTMVVNSYTSASESEWGFGIPIVHGISADNWLDLPKEPRVFTALSHGGLDAFYNRDCLRKASEILWNKYGYILWHAKNNIATDTSPGKYQDFLGRSLLYFDPSFRTPMNRGRTEAFLSGCCVIQVEGAHDLDRWAIPNQNIILVPNDPEQMASTIADFLENRYTEALKVGQNGKKMAIEQFNPKRYRHDWLALLEKVVKSKK
jgi:glycosyltransferase involved in cell wall biosynthesis